MTNRNLAKTKNGFTVFINDKSTHAITHLEDTPKLMALIKEAIPQIVAHEDNIYLDINLGRDVGKTDLVQTTKSDEIIYAKRKHRDTYTRFVINRSPTPTNYVAIVLNKEEDGYRLESAWIGRAVPMTPGDPFETPDSKEFWSKHALVWGNQEIVKGSETVECPWD